MGAIPYLLVLWDDLSIFCYSFFGILLSILWITTQTMPEQAWASNHELLLRRPNQRVRAGSIALPKGDGPFPVAVLLPGSGKHKRETPIAEYPWGSSVTNALCTHGIALIRLDDPGTGASSGDKFQLTIQDLLDDVSETIQATKAFPCLDPHKIGLIGHSEGGMFAYLAGKELIDLEFLVLMAAPARPLGVIVLEQFEANALRKDLTPKAASTVRRELGALFHQLSQEPIEAGRHLMMQQFQKRVLSLHSSLNWSSFWQEGLVASGWNIRFASPWFHSHLQRNQASINHSIQALPQRVLVMQGSSDIQVSPQKDFSLLTQLMKESSIDYKQVMFNGLDHVFGSNPAGVSDHYGMDMSTLERKVLPMIAGWITAPQAPDKRTSNDNILKTMSPDKRPLNPRA